MAASNPRILAISFHDRPLFDQSYAPFLTQLAVTANLYYAVTDEALTLAENRRVWEAVLTYIRKGGIAIAMGLFSSFVKPKKLKPFFSRAGLAWDVGSYHRTTLFLNSQAMDENIARRMLPEYSQKAQFVKNVASGDIWYKPDSNSVVESVVWALVNGHRETANIEGETAVAFAKVGDERLGYLGNVNVKAGLDIVMLAMCGL